MIMERSCGQFYVQPIFLQESDEDIQQLCVVSKIASTTMPHANISELTKTSRHELARRKEALAHESSQDDSNRYSFSSFSASSPPSTQNSTHPTTRGHPWGCKKRANISTSPF